MFAKQNRLAKTTDVQTVFARGRAFFNPLFTVKFLSRPGSKSRFTVVVSTKVAKSAVKRNRIKRVIREAIRLSLGKFKTGDYVIVAKPVAAQKQAAELREKFTEVITRNRLLNQ